MFKSEILGVPASFLTQESLNREAMARQLGLSASGIKKLQIANKQHKVECYAMHLGIRGL